MKHRILFLLSLSLVLSVSAQRHESLLTTWQFAFETIDHKMPQEGWQVVTLPHDWAISGDFSRDNDLQNVAITQNGSDVPSVRTGRTGGLPYVGKAWYRTVLNIKKRQHTELLFDGAMSEAEVYVNGRRVMFWPYGYNAFAVDITPYISRGANGIMVRLENHPESSRWYPGAGLYRQVHVIQTPEIHIPIWGTQIKTLSLGKEKAQISVKTRVIGSQKKKIKVKTEILLGETRVAEMTTPALLESKADVEQLIDIEQPQCWSPETPVCYTAKIHIYAGSAHVDTYTQTFGLRTVEIKPNVGFLLNGEVRKFQGVCLHHDLGPLGAAAHRDAIKHQLQMLKDMGCDAVRTSHNMPAPELVELADSMGVMLMVEPFDEWEWGKCKNGYNRYFDKKEEGQEKTWAERDMVNMLRHFRNNPSVVMWSIGNEVPTQCSPDGYKVAKFLQDICNREDGTRPITCGMDGVDCVLENGFAAVMQVVGINYRAHRYQEIYDATPQKLVLGSETASTVSTRQWYRLPAVKDNNDSICNQPHPNGNSRTNQCSGYDLEYCPWSNIPDDDFRNMEDYPWTIGQFVWTGFDYLGEPSPWDTDAWPSHSSYFGIIDLASIPKDRYWLYRSQWNKKDHTLHLLPHWNWQPGDTVPVMVYTDLAEAELFLNGRSLGRQRFLRKEETAYDTVWGHIRRYRLIWDAVPFEAGELRVVGIDAQGNEVMQTSRFTAQQPHQLQLIPSRTGSLTYLRVRVTDQNGHLCPTADNPVHIDVSGQGRMLGAANGDATCLIPFQSADQQVFGGEMTIIVQGDATVRVTSPGLNETSCTVSVKDKE